VTPPRGICAHCDQPVTQTQRAAFRARGFEIERSAGGANYISHRERQPDKIWHDFCVDAWVRHQQGVGEQTNLLDNQ
jgi:hypothetical protein